MSTKKIELSQRRQRRARTRLRNVGHGRLRLSVYRSGRHIYVQIVDDAKSATVAAASTLDPDLRKQLKSGANRDAAGAVGTLIAARAKTAGVTKVMFDRGGYRYHGRLKALAEAARAGGLEF
jgi:large subunit ribosomal protein L18